MLSKVSLVGAQLFFIPDRQDVTSVAWSSDGAHILSSGFDGTIRLWKADSCDSGPFIYIDDPRIREGEDDSRDSLRGVMSVAWSPDGKRFVAGLRDRTVRLYKVEVDHPFGRIFEEIEIFSTDDMGGLRTVAYSPDGTMIASGGHDSIIRLWEPKREGSLIRELRGHRDMVEALMFSQDGTRLLSTSRDGTLRLWDLKTGQLNLSIKTSGPVYAAAFSPDAKQVAGASDSFDGKQSSIHVWHTGDGQEIRNFLLKNPVHSLSFSPDGRHVASGGLGSGEVQVWNIQSGIIDLELRVPYEARIRGMTYSPDGQYILTGIPKNPSIIWNAQTGRIIRELGKCSNVSLP
jgi:WD40 repeat protein